MQCGSFDIVTFDKILSSTGFVGVGSIKARSGLIARIRASNLEYSATPVQLLGSQVLDNTLLFARSFEQGDTEFILPTADDIVAAFIADGKPLAVGDIFTVYIARMMMSEQDIHAVTFVHGSAAHAVTFVGFDTEIVVPANASVVLKFEVTALGDTPAIRVHILSFVPYKPID